MPGLRAADGGELCSVRRVSCEPEARFFLKQPGFWPTNAPTLSWLAPTNIADSNRLGGASRLRWWRPRAAVWNLVDERDLAVLRSDCVGGWWACSAIAPRVSARSGRTRDYTSPFLVRTGNFDTRHGVLLPIKLLTAGAGTVEEFRAQASTTRGGAAPVAREAHNLEVAGSNPVPATFSPRIETERPCGERRKPRHTPRLFALVRQNCQRVT